MAADVREVHHMHDQPVKVLLKRSGKGGYVWEIQVQGPTPEAVMPVLRETNRKLMLEYGSKDQGRKA